MKYALLLAVLLLSGCDRDYTQGIKCIDGKAYTQSNVNPEVYYPTDKPCKVIK